MTASKTKKRFLAVRKVSEVTDLFYRIFLSPWIRIANNDWAAETLRQLHPLRIQRYLLSDLNPWMFPFKSWASNIKHNGQRRPAAEDNLFSAWEGTISDIIVDWLNYYRDARDAGCELMFQTMYENPWMKILSDYVGTVAPENEPQLEEMRRRDAERWRKNMTIGECPDAMVRIFLAIGLADQALDRKGYQVVSRILNASPRMKDIELDDMRQIIREQSRIIQTDADQAIATLPHLLSKKRDRRDALSLIAKTLEAIGRPLEPPEQAVLERVQAVLQP